jgi:putative transposase
MARSTLAYELRQPAKDEPVIAAMKRLSAQYPRYGYRRIRIFLRREGLVMSPARAERLWRKAGLQLPRRRPRRRVATSRQRPLPPRAANHVWAYDFVFDACANGQQIKCLTVVDEFTRECLAIDVAGSIRSERVIEVLARLISVHGVPAVLRSDNGPEFVSSAVLRWLTAERIDVAHIDPGKPWQNGTDESFNGKLRDECLSLGVVPQPARSPHRDRNMAEALQRGPPALQPRLFDSARIQAAPFASNAPSTPSHSPGIDRSKNRGQVRS